MHRPQLRLQTLSHRSPPHHKPAFSVLTADMRQSQKVKSLWFTRAALLPAFRRESAKLNQPRFLGMQLQAELPETLLQFSQASLRVRAMLESHNEVIDVAHHDYLAIRPLLPPLLNPQVEHVVEIGIRQQR